MSTIRTLCGHNPAIAIKAMIDGLITYKSIKNFRLDFITFGIWKNGVCSGCAATITLIRLMNLSFAPYQLGQDFARAGLMSTSLPDLLDFEKAIDMFRRGRFLEIERYFGLPTSEIFCFPWYCHGGNLQNELPKIIRFWERLTGQKYQLPTSQGFGVYHSPNNASRKDFKGHWATAVAQTQQPLLVVA